MTFTAFDITDRMITRKTYSVEVFTQKIGLLLMFNAITDDQYEQLMTKLLATV